jgi:hypothetical protein
VETNKVFTELQARELQLFATDVVRSGNAVAAPTVLSAPAAGQCIGRHRWRRCHRSHERKSMSIQVNDVNRLLVSIRGRLLKRQHVTWLDPLNGCSFRVLVAYLASDVYY